jgi:hypothetical protein
MSAWDLIGKASATKTGTPFSPGTKGEAVVLALRQFTSNNGEGEILVIELAVHKSEKKSDKYVKDMSTGELADVLVQSPGTKVSSLYMLSKHKAAPGAAKAAILAVNDTSEESCTPEQFAQIVELCRVDDGRALHGVKVAFDVHTKLTRASKKTIHPVQFSGMGAANTDASIDEMMKLYPR